MENASKALIMAGSVLIGVIVVSLFMVMANSLTDYQQTQTQNQREAQTISFNNSYEGYIRDNVKGYELMSLVNKVVDYNKRQSSKGTAKDEQGQDLGFDPIELTIDLTNNGALNKQDIANLFTRNGELELFKGPNFKYTFNDNKKTINSEMKFNEIIKKIQSAKLPTCNYHNSTNWPRIESDPKDGFQFTDAKLSSLLDNYDTIFAYKDYKKQQLSEVSKEEKNKVLKTFNLAFGENYFQLYKSDKNKKVYEFLDTPSEYMNDNKNDYNYIIINWLQENSSHNMFENNNDIYFRNKTLYDVLNTYYEYDQFKRAEFKCVNSEYSDTGRIIKLDFVFTGKID